MRLGADGFSTSLCSGSFNPSGNQAARHCRSDPNCHPDREYSLARIVISSTAATGWKQSQMVFSPFHHLNNKISVLACKIDRARRRNRPALSVWPNGQLSLMGRSAPYLRRNLPWLWSTDQRGGRWRGCMLVRKCCLQRRSRSMSPCSPRLAWARTTFRP